MEVEHQRDTYDIGIRGCAYEGSNPDPNMGPSKLCF